MPDNRLKVERVQTGVRLEKRMVKVLKALAEYHDISLAELLEGIVLHALEGEATPFSAETLRAEDIYDVKRAKFSRRRTRSESDQSIRPWDII